MPTREERLMSSRRRTTATREEEGIRCQGMMHGVRKGVDTHIDLVMFVANSQVVQERRFVEEHEGTVVVDVSPVIFLAGKRASIRRCYRLQRHMPVQCRRRRRSHEAAPGAAGVRESQGNNKTKGET